jgi:hypothetical protein
MKIKISDEKTLGQVKKEFSYLFPNLKIEFYKVPHRENEGSINKNLLNEDLTIGKVRNVHTDGELFINADSVTAEVESEFKKQYGLNVQIFRRSGKLWLQTTSTDFWSLEQQEKAALERNQMGEVKDIEILDLD